MASEPFPGLDLQQALAARRAILTLRAAGLTVDADAIRIAAPEWRPGDVIVVQFHEGGREYTYVRGAQVWPGELRPLIDERVDGLYARGLVRPVLRAGGRPWTEAAK